MSEKIQITKAKTMLQKMANGINPIDGELIREDSVLNDPLIIRSFFYVSSLLDDIMNGVYKKRNSKAFQLTVDQKNSIVLPNGKIGINDFAKSVNEVLDINMKKLTGVDLNRRLKQMNVLAEVKTVDGKKATSINENSFEFGFELERRVYNGQEYNKVVINDDGKCYLLNNLESIMA